MAKNSAEQQNPSLLLHEVLEEEYAQLHGPFPANPEAVRPADRLKHYWAVVHRLEEKQAALCLSGGGIRSATFALGILQGLARCGLLPKFHYLSTVSGGGYIGSWLTAWIHNAPRGLGEVVGKLAQPRRHTRPNPEPDEIRNLRSYSNYLSPRLGLFSADAWTLVGTYLRNLLLNWLVLIPLLAAVLTVPWIYTAVLMTTPAPYTLLPVWIGGSGVALGVAYMGLNLPGSGDRRGSQNSFLFFCLLPIFIAALAMTIGWAWFRNYERPLPQWSFLGITPPHPVVAFIYFGIAVHLASWANSLLRAHGFRFKEIIAVIVSGALGGVLLWLGATKIFNQPLAIAEVYSCVAVPIFLAFIFLAVMAYAGISSRWTGDPDREWWGRATGWLLAVATAWIAISSFVIFGPLVLTWTTSAISTLTIGGIAGALTIFAGRSSSIPATDREREKAGPLALLLSKSTTIAAVLFVATLMIVITKVTTAVAKQIGLALSIPWNLKGKSAAVGETVEYLNVILYTPWWLISAITLALLLIGMGMAHLINPNKFSLHAMYRDRLIRAYLGASHKERAPNPFTGFDEKDNRRMWELWSREKFDGKLLPVVNIALNLVGGENLAWQERKAASFTVSPFHCGSHAPGCGYRKTGGEKGHRYGSEEGISVGTAIAISGAAASPNMGYHSSALVTFILTLLNVRLGAWLGNPGPAGDDTYALNYPTFSVRPIISEALGLTNARNPYVYLSDGGHFENLGLYEMVLRRCHYIVVSDAGQDPACAFADLGGAVRKIRIDLGLSIEFDDMCIFGRDDTPPAGVEGRCAAVGRIRYSQVDGPDAPDGVIVYLKPACYGKEPRDIYEYFKTSKTFPHEPTSDQFFTETQFESYRMLGVHTMDLLCSERVRSFSEFIAQVERRAAEETEAG